MIHHYPENSSRCPTFRSAAAVSSEAPSSGGAALGLGLDLRAAFAAESSGAPKAGKIGDFKISLAKWSLHKALVSKTIANLAGEIGENRCQFRNRRIGVRENRCQFYFRAGESGGENWCQFYFRR